MVLDEFTKGLIKKQITGLYDRFEPKGIFSLDEEQIEEIVDMLCADDESGLDKRINIWVEDFTFEIKKRIKEMYAEQGQEYQPRPGEVPSHEKPIRNFIAMALVEVKKVKEQKEGKEGDFTRKKEAEIIDFKTGKRK